MNNKKILIDKRPIQHVLVNRVWRFCVLCGLFFLLNLYLQQEPWEGLTPEGYKAIGAFLLCAILWLTQLLPLAVTGLLSIVILPLLDIIPSHRVFGYFGNEAVFFILGAFILAAAVMKSGLSTRLSLILLKNATSSPKKLVFRILFTTAIFSCFMSEHAVAAFFFPIIMEIARALEFEPFGGEYGKSLFLALAWGCVIGGIVTFLGGARTPLALAIYSEITGGHLSFFEWMQISTFIAVPLLFVAYLILTRFIKIDVTGVENAQTVLAKKSKEIGMITFRERMVALVMLASVFLWVTKSDTLGLANIAIAGVVALFVFRLVSWKDIEGSVNWGIILMYGGAIALSRAVDSTGALTWIGEQILVIPNWLVVHVGGGVGIWLVAVLSLFVIVMTEVVSNAAVVALLLPLAIALTDNVGLDPKIAVYVVALPSGLAFLLPIATPAVALAYSSGYLKVREILLPGVMLIFSGWLFFIFIAKYIWPFFGLVLE